MSKETIQDLLSQLQAEVQDTTLDPETRALMVSLDVEMQSLLAAPVGEGNNASLPETMQLPETAQLLEAQFAANHPTAERFVRELMDALVKMGI